MGFQSGMGSQNPLQPPSVDKKVRLSKLTSYFWRSLSVQLRTYGLTSPPSGAMLVLTELLRQWCHWPRALRYFARARKLIEVVLTHTFKRLLARTGLVVVCWK